MYVALLALVQSPKDPRTAVEALGSIILLLKTILFNLIHHLGEVRE
jgi:hypothetical protein